MRSRPSGLLAILTVLAVLLAALGLALLGIYLYARVRPPIAVPNSPDPWIAAHTVPVAPALALRTLAGEDPVITARAALSLGDLDTARQLVALNPTLTDAVRLGQLQILARGFAAEDRTTDAEIALGQAERISVLSPSLSDVARVEAALSTSSVWQAMGALSQAGDALTTARLIIESSHSLRAAQRNDLWNRLATAYDSLGLADTIDERYRTAERASYSGSPVALQLRIEYPLAPYQLPQDLAELRGQRQLRAVRLIEQWTAQSGGDVGPETADLAEYLIREDQELSAHLTEVIASAPELSLRAAAAWEHVDWLSCKYRVAVGSYGLSLIQQWEENAPLIRSELAKGYEVLFRVLGDQVTALPDADTIEPGRLALLRYRILLGEIFLFPDYPREHVVEQLLTSQEMTPSESATGYLIDAWPDDGSWKFAVRVQTAP